MTKPMTIETVERQRRYVESQTKKGKGLGVVFADAFLRGMRDLGYKNPAWALAELIDNSFQADAHCVAIRLGFEGASETKPDLIAICDDGNGMIPAMIGYAVRWGGTDREGDRKGFGRYGYGLPSAAVSMAKRYTVYSKTRGDKWHAVTVDIDALAEVAGDIAKTEALLTAKAASLPSWISTASTLVDRLDVTDLESGTVIVLEDLDRLKQLGGWIKSESLVSKLLQHFGVIYRHWIPDRRICVGGTEVQPVDPLFAMEHARFYGDTSVTAQRVETRTLEVETARGTKGTITIRASVLPPHFQLAVPNEYGVKGAKLHRGRHDIMKDYNGLLICRERRQIDCIQPRWTKFQNLDMNVKIEIDFDPELDEHFGMTTSKQQIVIEEDMWQRLRGKGANCGGLEDLVVDLRNSRDEIGKELKAKAGNRKGQQEPPRPSEQAMADSAKFADGEPQPSQEQSAEAERNLDERAEKVASDTGQPKEQVKEDLRSKSASRRWEVQFASIPEGPFFKPFRFSQQKQLLINTDHPFYGSVYEQASPDVKHALEVLLFVLAERELASRGDAETFYKAERQKWSERLRHALEQLIPGETMANKAAAVAESLYATESEVEPEPVS